jgi:hypothetical protein
MDQNNPNNSGIGSGSSGFGTGTSGSTGSGSTASGSGFNTGGTGSGMSSGGGMSTTGSGGTGSPAGGFGVTSASDTGAGAGGGTETCAHCGQSLRSGGGLDQFLGKLGITEDMIGNLKGQFQNVDIDEYLNTARDYLKDSGGKAQTYAKENPGKVAAGVAALALGAGLLYAAVNRDKA